jgi:hypothetical protein
MRATGSLLLFMRALGQYSAQAIRAGGALNRKEKSNRWGSGEILLLTRTKKGGAVDAGAASNIRRALQRRYRLASDTLVYDLQFRLRRSHGNARAGFRITIFDEFEAKVGAGGYHEA